MLGVLFTEKSVWYALNTIKKDFLYLVEISN